jgi:hypothetical protein
MSITFIYLLIPCVLRFARKPSHALLGIVSLESEGQPLGWISLYLSEWQVIGFSSFFR